MYFPSGQSKTEFNQIQVSVAREQVSLLHCGMSMIHITCALGNSGTVIKSSLLTLLLLLLLFYCCICTRLRIITEALAIPSSGILNLIFILVQSCLLWNKNTSFFREHLFNTMTEDEDTEG